MKYNTNNSFIKIIKVVVDVINALTDSKEPRKYWSVLKTRLKKEGSELTTNCSQLKLKSKDGKYYSHDVLDTKGILRLIESVPSPKAEPFKLWLAQMGKERIDEVFDPEIAVNRAVDYYRAKGYDDKWIKARLTGVVDRRKLTDIWKENGITKDYEYGILTNIDLVFILTEVKDMYLIPKKSIKNVSTLSLCDKYNQYKVFL